MLRSVQVERYGEEQPLTREVQACAWLLGLKTPGLRAGTKSSGSQRRPESTQLQGKKAQLLFITHRHQAWRGAWRAPVSGSSTTKEDRGSVAHDRLPARAQARSLQEARGWLQTRWTSSPKRYAAQRIEVGLECQRRGHWPVAELRGRPCADCVASGCSRKAVRGTCTKPGRRGLLQAGGGRLR